MKQFQLKTLTELTSEEQQFVVAGSTANGGCSCTCTCGCYGGENSKSITDNKTKAETNTVYLE